MSRLKQYPFLRLLVPFMAGVSVGMLWPTQILPAHLCVFVLMFLIALLFSIYFIEPYDSVLFGSVLFLFLFLAGIYHAGRRSSLLEERMNEGYGTYLAKVMGSPVKKERSYRILLMVRAVDRYGKPVGNRQKVYATLAVDTVVTTLAYGDLILCRGWLSQVDPPMNPGEFDYRKFLFRQGITGQIYLDKDSWRKTGIQGGSKWSVFFHSFRNDLIEKLRAGRMGEREFQVLAALSLGYRDEMDPGLRQGYAGAGAMHFLAISGLHVGILYLFLYALLGFLVRIPGGHLIRTVLVMLALIFYALLSGLSPSVCRAVTMFGFFAAGGALQRHVNTYNVLAASAMFMLLINPFLLADVGFQLSYLAVAGIVYFQPRIFRLLIPPGRIISWLWKLVSVSLAAQLVTFPLTMYYFHIFPVCFPLSNVLVLPLITLLLGLCLVFFVAGSVFPWLGGVAAWLAGKVAWCMNESVQWLGSLPWATISDIYLSVFHVILLYGMLATLVPAAKGKGKAFRWAFLTMVLIFAADRSRLAAVMDRQHELTVYRIPGGSMIGITRGRTCVARIRPVTENGWYDYHTQNHRISMGIKDLVRWEKAATCEDYGIIQTAMAAYVQGKGIKIGILEENFPVTCRCDRRLNLDVLILTGNVRIAPGILEQCFDPGLVVLDGSLGYYRTREWVNYLKEKKIPFHAVYVDGAFQCSL
ncbi:MAG: ComEC/Rec2 family competence protein [Bacteroidales bacterium]